MKMNELKLCQQCGGPVPQTGELAGRCPHCMLVLGFESWDGRAEPSESMSGESVDQSPAALSHSGTIGRYRILGLIGEGGMGSVYEAEQDHPRRIVALKIIRPAMASPELLRRFEQESQALGRLQHPGIAQIYEAGTVDTGFGPQPYFAMEFVRGRSPREYAEAHDLTTRDRMEMVAKICDGVHHAHQRGLIHRDLKPGNILVDDTGQPKILDFGVARVTDSDSRSTQQTDVGQLIGTLAYMSPEQALADPLDIDIRTDVYALGVILYELLSGQLPYPISKKIHETIQTIREQDPTRLGAVHRNYRGDIETIVAKALEKDRARRYASAAEVAADIRRYLNDEPIVARPPSTTYQLGKFARRNKVLVSSTVAVLVVLVTGAATATLLAMRFSRERDRVAQAQKETSIERDRANANEKSATAAAEDAHEQLIVATKEKARADYQAELSSRDRDRIAWQALARESVRLSGNRENDELAALLARQAFRVHSRTPEQPRFLVEEALQQAGRLNPFGRVISGHSGVITSVAFSPDGKLFASGSVDRTVRVWDLNNSNVPPLVFAHTDDVNAVAFSPDGTLLAASSEGSTIRIWNLREPTAPPRTGYSQGNIYSVAFSPDGSLLAIGTSSGVSIWAVPNLASTSFMLESNARITSIAFSPDGSRLATSGSRGVRIWDFRNPGTAPLMQLDRDSNFISVAFSSDDMHVAARHFSGEVRVWDLRVPDSSGRIFAESSAPPLSSPRVVVRTNSVGFSPDGKHVASSGDDGIIRVWDLRQSGTIPVLSLRGHRGIASAVAFSSDGARLASGGYDYLVHIWSLLEPEPALKHFKAHQGAVESLAFSPNNAYLASGGTDQTVRLWDPRSPKQPPVALQHEDAVLSLDFSEDSQLLASATTGLVRVWTILRPGTQPLSIPDRSVQSFGFSPDGTTLTGFSIRSPDSAGWRPGAASVKRWNLRTAQSQTVLELTANRAVARSNDWSRVASGQADGSIQVWDLRRPRRSQLSLAGNIGIANASAFSQRGDLVASIGLDRNVRVWKLENPNAPTLTFPGPSFRFIAFTLEDTRLLAAGVDADGVRMWDLREPGAPPLIFKGSNADIRSIAVSRDGTYLAVGDREGNIWVWALWKAAADQVCARVTRNLSIQEWWFYVGESIPYERTCPALPAGIGVP
jgi:eukaryotic-like serine/threonine-protein kinase